MLTVDLPAASQREQIATGGRSVRCWAGVDGQGVVQARGPLAMIAAVKASLDATLPTEAEPGDERATDARLFDLVIELLTGGVAGPGRWEAQILVPVTTAQGGGLELAELPGFGPVLPTTAQDLLAGCDAVRRVAVDDDSGQVLVVDDAVSLPFGGRVDPTTGELFTGEPVTASPAPGTDPVGGWVCAPRLRSELARMRTDPIVAPALTTGAYRPSGRLVRLLAARH